jgi:8-oxo-dGTP diphosphatase
LPLYKQVVTVILHFDFNLFLFQLRDFKPFIVHPGHWGAFGGEIDSGETPFQAAKRELNEEIGHVPQSIHFFKNVESEEYKIYTHLFYAEIKVPFDQLELMEGADMGTFSREDILKGNLYSQNFKSLYPVAPPLLRFYDDFFRQVLPKDKIT